MTEVWKAIPGFDGYEASSEGRVRRSAREPLWARNRILRGHHHKKTGYRSLSLRVNGGGVVVLEHRLICAAFHGLPPSPKHQCAHGDANRLNNRPENLRWATHAENVEDRNRHGNTLAGERHPMTKSSRLEVEIIRRMYTDGFEQRDIGRAFGLNQGQVWRICWNKSWSSARPTPMTLARLRRKNPKAWAEVTPLDRWSAAQAVARMEAA